MTICPKSVALGRQRCVQRGDCVDGQCAVTFELHLEVMMSMRRSVQACDNCAGDN